MLVSSMHDDKIFDEETIKPDTIMDYHATKGSVDTIDKMCETYNIDDGLWLYFMVY